MMAENSESEDSVFGVGYGGTIPPYVRHPVPRAGDLLGGRWWVPTDYAPYQD